MTDAPAATAWKGAAMRRRIVRRRGAERRFRLLGRGAILLSAAFLAFLLATMAMQGWSGFLRTDVALPLNLAGRLAVDPARLAAPGAELALAAAGLEQAVDAAAARAFPDAGGAALLADDAWRAAAEAIRRDPALLRRAGVVRVPVAAAIDTARKRGGDPAAEATVARLGDRLALRWNGGFFAVADSTDPGRVGIWGALKGSLLTMAVTLALAFPIGTGAAIYLEEYAPRNRWTDLIEVSINNLAAVPSIIFGLLGLALFLGTLGMPRSAPLVGGVTLALMTMPVIVIAGRVALRAVPPSVREAALAVGASPVQVTFHHVLPLALPGILTGTIIGLARALGETAPLLLIGMRAFIAAPPGGLADPATVLPVQIFLWSDEVDGGFVEKTSAAILVLLALLLTINGVALWLRDRFETRW